MSHSITLHTSKTYTAAIGRKFGLTVGIAFGVIGGISRWRGHVTVSSVLIGIGAALVLAGLLMPRALRQVDSAWNKLALLISRVTTPIFMGVIYYVVLTPVGIVRRTFGGNALVHDKTGGSTAWFPRGTAPRSNLDRLF